MKEVWLVILGKSHERRVEGTDFFTPYANLYRVYENRNDALAWAKENGFEDPFRMGVSEKVGQATFFKCGDVDIMIMKQLVR